jgi:hypothetical protein
MQWGRAGKQTLLIFVHHGESLLLLQIIENKTPQEYCGV